MWVRKVAPWCRDPWPSVGDPTRCGVCAGTVARGSSVSRGEALSPQTATESMARGALSAPLSIILPPCLSLSLFLSHFSFLSLSLSHCFLFAPSLTFPHSLSLLPHSLSLSVLLSFAFVFLTFSFCSIRFVLFYLHYSFAFSRLQLPHSLTYTHFNLPSVTFSLFPHSLICSPRPFFSLGALFKSKHVFYSSFRLTKQMLRKDAIHCCNSKRNTYSVIYHTQGIWLKRWGNREVDKRANKEDKKLASAK